MGNDRRRILGKLVVMRLLRIGSRDEDNISLIPRFLDGAPASISVGVWRHVYALRYLESYEIWSGTDTLMSWSGTDLCIRILV